MRQGCSIPLKTPMSSRRQCRSLTNRDGLTVRARDVWALLSARHKEVLHVPTYFNVHAPHQDEEAIEAYASTKFKNDVFLRARTVSVMILTKMVETREARQLLGRSLA